MADVKDIGRLFAWDLVTDQVTELSADEYRCGEMDRWNNLLVCLSDNQGVIAYDVDRPDSELAFHVGIQEAGFPARPEEVMSIEVLDDTVYVGGHRQTTMHDPADGDMGRIAHQGEPKVMASVDDTLYQAVYSKAKLRRYDPATEVYEELATIGHQQNRPRSIHYHEGSGLLLVGTRPYYGILGGAVATVDPQTNELLAVDRDVLEDQSITAITAIGDEVFLGSEIYGGAGSTPTTSCARIGSWDPVERTLQWDEPLEGIMGITSLVPTDSTLVGLTEGYSDVAEISRPQLFTFDLETRQLTRHDRLDPARGGMLVPYEDVILGVTSNQLFRFDPETDRSTVLLDDLDPDYESWHNFPHLAVDSAGTVYVIKNRELIAVRP